jgi:hypothetical protein
MVRSDRPEGRRDRSFGRRGRRRKSLDGLRPRDRLPDLELELFAFPGSRHDDQCDSISQALSDENVRFPMRISPEAIARMSQPVPGTRFASFHFGRGYDDSYLHRSGLRMMRKVGSR